MLADKRKVWGGVLILFLLCSMITFRILDNGVLCSVALKSEEKLMQMCSDKTFVEHAADAGNLLLFDGQSIPYDEESNCFYICQNMETKDYHGTITAASNNLAIWIAKDEYIHKLEDAIREGHSFAVWIAANDTYTICHIVFTGMPVVVLHTEEDIGTEYLFGTIDVWNPHDQEIITVSCKESHMRIKCSESMETYTAKLMEQDNVNNRRLSLLDMGKYDAWKFYAVSQKDKTYLRSMLSYLLWNHINTNEKFNRPCQYAEVLVNNEYKGLFLVAPRIDDDFLELGATGEVISVKLPQNEREILGEYSDDDTVYRAADAYHLETLNFDNLVEYFLFLETTYAYQNVSDNFYAIWDSTCEQSFLMPGKIEYSFNTFPNRLQYLTWQAQERVLTPQLLEMEGAFSDKDIQQQMQQKWQALRSGILSNDELIRLTEELDFYLNESGYVIRCGIASGNTYAHAESIGEFKNYLMARMEVLDRYYETGE